MREQTKKRDKDRPVIVHCLGLLVQRATLCDDDEAIQAAWDVWDYLGQPTTVAAMPPDQARKILQRPPQTELA